MKPRAFLFFSEVAKTGSVKKASENLFISPSSILNAIKSLEKEYNIIVFDRSSKGMRLTNEGTELLSHVNMLLQYMEHMEDELKMKCVKPDIIKFRVHSQMYELPLVAFSEMIKSYEKEKIDFVYKNYPAAKILTDIKTRECDIGVISYSELQEQNTLKLIEFDGLEYKIVAKYNKIYVRLRKGHPLAQMETLTVDDIVDFPIVSIGEGYSSWSLYLPAMDSLNKKIYKHIFVNERSALIEIISRTNCISLGLPINYQNDDIISIPFLSITTTLSIVCIWHNSNNREFLINQYIKLIDSFVIDLSI